MRSSRLAGEPPQPAPRPQAFGDSIRHLTAMKYPVARFKSMEEALEQLEPSIRDGEHLQTGKPFPEFHGLRSREILANWLLCVALNFTNQQERFTFGSDPLGGDGII